MKYIDRYLNVKIESESRSTPFNFGLDWKITFSIKKNASSNYLAFNTCVFTIYNLTSETRTLLSYPNQKVTITAGYKEKKGVIFDGIINNVVTTKNNNDIITTFYCVSDTYKYCQPVNITSQGQLVTDLLKQICEKNNIPCDLPFTSSETVNNSYHGTVQKVIAQICFDYNISAGIENGTLVFRNKKLPSEMISDTSIITITPNTGVLSSPTVTDVGVNVKTLMNSDFQVNDYFKLRADYADYNLNDLTNRKDTVLGNQLKAFAFIDTKTYNGLYMILSMKISGDTRGNTWWTEIEGSRIGGKNGY